MDLEVTKPHFDRLLAARSFPKTLCPSEVARALSAAELQSAGAASWRDLMSDIRQQVFELRDAGEIEILQKGRVLDDDQTYDNTTGPIRIRKKQVEQG